MSVAHPCLSCGACCATFRVSFYRGEALPGPGALPEELVEDIGPFRVAMRGTAVARSPRCVALEGDIGGATRCGIYPLRPSPCREVVASWEAGEPDPQCDKARAAHGLPALRPQDWEPDQPRTPPVRPRRAA